MEALGECAECLLHVVVQGSQAIPIFSWGCVQLLHNDVRTIAG